MPLLMEQTVVDGATKKKTQVNIDISFIITYICIMTKLSDLIRSEKGEKGDKGDPGTGGGIKALKLARRKL